MSNPNTLLKSAKAHADEARDLMQNACGAAACAGLDLYLYKHTLGVKRGGDRKSNPHAVGLIRWEDKVSEVVGISDQTAHRWIQLGTGLLSRVNVTDEEFTAMSEDKRDAVKVKIRRLTEGKTQLDFFKQLAEFSRGGATHREGSKGKLDKLAITQGPEAVFATLRASAPKIWTQIENELEAYDADTRTSPALLKYSSRDEIELQLAALEAAVSRRKAALRDGAFVK